jgi:hypothetical protein
MRYLPDHRKTHCHLLHVCAAFGGTNSNVFSWLKALSERLEPTEYITV